jgi:aspartate/methionine/tyrosine aminotransferase
MDKLAIEGGPKAVTNQLIGWPRFDEKAISAVTEVLKSGRVNYWTGKKGMEFEKKFAEWQGSKYAISVATGTAALHVALSALEIGPGDEVIVPSYTFIATSFAVVQAGVGGEAGERAHEGHYSRALIRECLRHGQDLGLREAS